MKISVLMPCYNGSRWISEAIESVLNQTFSDFEFIAVDDGSSDDTLDVLHLYRSTDNRMKVFAKQNTGCSDTLNYGISKATGDWIARIDQDDVCEPSRLLDQMLFLDESPDVVLLGSAFTEIDNCGIKGKTHVYPADHNGLLRRLKVLKGFFPHSSAIYRRDLVLKIGGYNVRLDKADDWWLWTHFASHGKIASLKKPLVKVRKHELQRSHEGSGRPQILHAVAGSVCYYLRNIAGVDPSIEYGDSDWEGFLAWVDSRLKDVSYYERRECWQSFRGRFFSDNNRSTFAYVHLISDLLMGSAYGVPLIIEKLFGSSLPRVLAGQWDLKLKVLNSDD